MISIIVKLNEVQLKNNQNLTSMSEGIRLRVQCLLGPLAIPVEKGE